MQKTHIRDFTKGKISTQLLTFAWPLFISDLLQIVYNMADMVIVGKVMGGVGSSAVSIGGDVIMLLTFIAMGFSAAGQVLIAKRIGSNRTHTIGKFIATMSGFMMSLAVIITIIGLIFQNDILRLMNTPEGSYEQASNYAMICMIGLVFIYGYNIVSATLRGMGDSKHPLMFIAIAAILNIILDLVFVAGFKMGAGGAALATVTSQAVSFICSVTFLFKHKEQFHLNVTLKDFIKWDKEMLTELWKLGMPMAIKSAAIMFSKLFVNSWINSYGVAVSAFAGIANKLSSIANLVSNSMNTAGSTMVGQNIAAKEYERVKQVMLTIATITLSIAVVISAVIVLFPEFVFGLFIDDPTVLVLSDKYIPIAVLLFFASAMRAIMNSIINGSGNYKINFVTAIIDGIVMRIGLAVLLGLVLDMQHYGFWLGDALAGFTPFFIGLVFYISGKWKNEVK